MASWAEFARQAPQIAAAGTRLLGEVSFLATVSSRGYPRLHPFCPAVAEGRLWAFIIEESPKRRDLDENGRFAMHALPGEQDEQFYLSGRAARETDAALRERVLRAMPYDDADARHILYEFRLRAAMWTTWDNFQQPGMKPVHRVWRERPSVTSAAHA